MCRDCECLHQMPLLLTVAVVVVEQRQDGEGTGAVGFLGCGWARSPQGSPALRPEQARVTDSDSQEAQLKARHPEQVEGAVAGAQEGYNGGTCKLAAAGLVDVVVEMERSDSAGHCPGSRGLDGAWKFLQAPSYQVFKKASPNGKLTVYLGKRDFVDHIDLVDPVDGVVLVDPEYLKERRVYVTLTCAFRYGREDLDVLGLTFRKDLFVANVQSFPPAPEDKKPLTRLQERLIKKLGEHAYPFTFEIPPDLPCSVTLQPGPEDTGKVGPPKGSIFLGAGHLVLRPLAPSLGGPEYSLDYYLASQPHLEMQSLLNSVRLVIRKVQYAPERPGPQPTAETTRQFLMSDKPLHLEASLDKE
ncbi:hypothetical protein MC885_012491, partial [Smutsia gigantea]